MSAASMPGGFPTFPLLSESRLLRFAVLSALYFAQGVPAGFVGFGAILWLKDAGVSEAASAGVMGLALVPWSFKLLWGPLLDRISWTRFGRRRPVILSAQLLMAASVLCLIPTDPSRGLAWPGALLFLHNTFQSVQDVATDGLAIDVLRPDERGRANAFMFISKIIGTSLGGGGGLILAKHVGWSWLFVALAVVVLGVMVLVALFREPPPSTPDDGRSNARFGLRILWKSFARGAAIAGLAIALLALTGYCLVSVVWIRQMEETGISREIVALTSTVDPFAAIPGALLAGLIVDRLGTRKVIALCMAAIGLLLGIWVAGGNVWTSVPLLLAWSLAITFAYSAFCVALFSLLMGMCNPAVGATQFAVFMAAFNLNAAWAVPAGGLLGNRFGAATTFLVAAAVQLAAVALLRLCPRDRAAFADPAPAASKPPGRPPPPVGSRDGP